MPWLSGSVANSTQFPLGLLRRLFRQVTSVTSPAGIPLCGFTLSVFLEALARGESREWATDAPYGWMHVHRLLRLHEIGSMISHVHRSSSVYGV
jgi:hypothetical protein